MNLCSDAESLLTQGDAAVLAAPEANFRSELNRIQLPATPFKAVETGYFDCESTNEAFEHSDLISALNNSGKSDEDVELITASLLAQRKKLAAFDEALEKWKYSPHVTANGNVEPDLHTVGSPTFPNIEFAEGLPAEFADYLEGSMAWHNPAMVDKGLARAAWERLLNRPPAERHYKSTWAAFMLGKSWEKEKPDVALSYYQEVRSLAADHFADSLGLASASLGQEALIYLNQTNYSRAVQLYAQQLATGDSRAAVSLILATRLLVSVPDLQLDTLVKDSLIRHVVTSYMISTMALKDSLAGVKQPALVVSNWLIAAKDEDVSDTTSVEELALAAYQNGNWKIAQEWIDRSNSSPVAQWLQAKLLLGAGKINKGAAILSRIAPLFTRSESDTNTPPGLMDNLTVSRSGYWPWVGAASRIRGELAVINVRGGNYAKALELFLNADLWQDAAYVAERILTVDELKDYVDQIRPAQSETNQDSETLLQPKAEIQQQLRYLLARRLTREIRGNEAREYYPVEWQQRFDELARALTFGWSETLSDDQRARALFEAAQITRTNGMELLGTEVGPDWHIYDGESEGSLSCDYRTNELFRLFRASPDELSRATAHAPDPDVRFHYRYQAAFLAWEAAKLMPNDSEETARVLAMAGTWLKGRDAQTADVFYKALVWRNRNTAIGAEADRRRWFPGFDDNGNVILSIPAVEPVPPGLTDQPDQADILMDVSTEAPEAPDPEDSPSEETYLVQKGDSLAAILNALSLMGRPVPLNQLLEANPSLDASRLRIGDPLIIPVPEKQNSDE